MKRGKKMAEKNPIVTIEMNDGAIIKAELYPEIAPNTVNNFISLINHGFFDGLIFHCQNRKQNFQHHKNVNGTNSV